MTPKGQSDGDEGDVHSCAKARWKRSRNNEYTISNREIVRKRCFLLGPPLGYITRIPDELMIIGKVS
jgi:hypothetical protein